MPQIRYREILFWKYRKSIPIHCTGSFSIWCGLAPFSIFFVPVFIIIVLLTLIVFRPKTERWQLSWLSMAMALMIPTIGAVSIVWLFIGYVMAFGSAFMIFSARIIQRIIVKEKLKLSLGFKSQSFSQRLESNF